MEYNNGPQAEVNLKVLAFVRFDQWLQRIKRNTDYYMLWNQMQSNESR